MKMFRSTTAIAKFAFAVAFLSLITLAGVRFVQASWTPPTSAPPGGNVAAPLNVSGVSQTKQGSLTIGGDYLNISGGYLNLGLGDILFATDDRGVFWSDNPDIRKPHIESATDVLYLSPGENAGSRTELQGDVKISTLGPITAPNPGSLIIENSENGRSLAFSLETGATGVDIKTPASRLIFNYDISQNVHFGGEANPKVKLCLNDAMETNCIDDWSDIGGGVGSGTAWYIPRWDTPTTLTNSVMYQRDDAWNGHFIGINDTFPNATLTLGPTSPSSLQSDIDLNPAENYLWRIKAIGSIGTLQDKRFYISAEDGDGTNALAINRLGETGLGVGTAIPTAMLHVKGRADGGIMDAGLINSAGVNVTQGGGQTYFDMFGPGDYIRALGQTRVINTVINPSNLTTTVAFAPPIGNQPYDILPSIARFADNTGTTKVLINTLGRVGLGTIDPQQVLHVIGNARISGLACNGLLNGGKVTTNASGDLICGDDTGGGGGGDTYMVKTDGTDTANFLNNELSAGSNITLSTVVVGGDTKLQIAASGGPGSSLWDGTEGGDIYPKTPSTTEVGIGVSDPQNRLEVGATIGGYQALRRQDAIINNDEDLGALYFTGDDGATSAIGAQIKGRATGGWSTSNYPTKLMFLTAPDGGTATERMVILQNGNAGIGLADPQNRLEVGTATGGYMALRRDDADNDINFSDDLGAFYFTGDHGAVADIIGAQIKAKADDNWALNSYPTRLSFFTRGAAGEAERMTLDSLGRVGINTPAPQKELHVTGNVRVSGLICNGFVNGGKVTSNANGDLICGDDVGGGGGGDNLGNHTATQNLKMSGYWVSNDGGSEGIFVDTAGKVGVGTSTPTAQLDVANSIRAYHTTNPYFQLNKTNATAREAYLEIVSDNLALTYVGAQRLVIDPSGNIKIPYLANCNGANTVDADSNGNLVCGPDMGGGAGDNLGNHIATQNLRMSGYWVSNDGGDEGLFVDTAGNVGIGTNSPTGSRLEVNGGYIRSRNTDGNYTGYQFADDEGLQWSWYKQNAADPFLALGRYTDNTWQDTPVVFRRNGTVEFLSGNVGIGTAPGSPLHIHRSGSDMNTWLQISTDDTSAQNADSSVLFGALSSNNWKETQIQYDERFGLVDKAASAWRLSISNQGETMIYDSTTADAPLFQVADSTNRYGQHHTIASYNDAAGIYNALSGFKGANAVSVNGSGVYGELVSLSNCTGTCAGVYGSIGGNTGAGEWAGYFDSKVNVGELYAMGSMAHRIQCPPHRVMVNELTSGWDEWITYEQCNLHADNAGADDGKHIIIVRPKICDNGACLPISVTGVTREQVCEEYGLQYGGDSSTGPSDGAYIYTSYPTDQWSDPAPPGGSANSWGSIDCMIASVNMTD